MQPAARHWRLCEEHVTALGVRGHPRNLLFWGYEVDIVHIAHFLKLDVPVSKLLGSEVHAVSLVSYVVILTEHATKIAAREENST